ncbi:glycosyltransferase [Desulfococcaceae bacterium HSG7]|nr:glycosyltransferase [Desulfococcaceae bacterium HSG7]
MPKVSVIIPCYNQGHYVDEAVDSVLEQTYNDFEIIIVNDGSTDKFTADLLNSYQKPETKVIHKTNQGLASARNNGIKAAQGEYILPLDADDKIGKEYLAEAVKVLDNNPGIGIVYCNAEVLGKAGKKWALPEYSLEEMLIDNIIFCSSFFRRKDWEEIGGYDPEMKYGWEDYDFWLALIEKGLLVYKIPLVLFFYRTVAESMVRSKAKQQKIETFVKIYHKHPKLFQKNIHIWIEKILESRKEYKAKLYIDTGLGFNENQTLNQVITGDSTTLEFDLRKFPNIRKIRFDPINDYAAVYIESIKGLTKNNTACEPDIYHCNAMYKDEGNFIFATYDPYLLLDFEDIQIDKLICAIRYIAIGKDSVPQIMEFKDAQHYEARLYVDTGLGFDEKNTLSQNIQRDSTHIEFDLSAFSHIKALRFDPIDDYAVLDIDAIEGLCADNTVCEVNIEHSNAVYVQNRNFVFDTDDPYLFLNFENDDNPKIDKLVCRLRFIKIGKEAFPLISQYRDIPQYEACLYIDTGLGMDEKQVSVQNITADSKRLEFDLSAFTQIKTLRFDPLDEYCMMRFHSIVCIAEDNSRYTITDFQSNAMDKKDKNMIFATNDPNIIMKLPDKSIVSVVFNIEFVAIGLAVLPYILQLKDEQVHLQYEDMHKSYEDAQKHNARLYLDTGIGFSEKQTFTRKITDDTTRIEFKLQGFSGVKRIRFDPCDEHCVLHLHSIKAVSEDNSTYKIEEFQSNAIHTEGGSFIFATDDPNIVCNWPDDKTDAVIDAVIIKLDLIAVGTGALPYILKYKDSALVQKEQAINEKTAKIHEQANTIEEIERQRQENEHALHQHRLSIETLAAQLNTEKNALQKMLHSRAWKLAASLRWLGKFVRKGKRRMLSFYYQFERQHKLIRASGLFDASYYLKQNPDVLQSEQDVLAHFIEKGGREGRNPCVLFDATYYLKCNPDLDESGMNPLIHYIHFGANEGRDPSPLFDTRYYLEQNPALSESGDNPLSHYLQSGVQKNINPNRLFDATYYLIQYPEVAETGLPLLEHYLKIGWQEGKNPNPLLDTAYYLNRYPEVNGSGRTPLEDYIVSGISAKRNPHPLFDTAYYLEQNPDVAASGRHPLTHFLEFGIREGRIPNPMIGKMKHHPKISIITPVYNVDEIYLRQCITSVLNQAYNNLELCLADDASPSAHIKSVLEEYAKLDSRVKVKYLKRNQGIAGASNEAASLAKGEYIGFLDHDDVLASDALYEIVQALNQYKADIVYTDERIIDAEGKQLSTHFKPAFSPELLFGHNYITHLMVTKKTLFRKTGGFSSECDGAQDYDLILKLTECTDKIVHLAKELYCWRSIDTSTSANPEQKSYADDAGKSALEAALKRRHIQGKVLTTQRRFYYHVKRRLTDTPLVSIIIPFKDQPDHLETCIESILEKSEYTNFEIIGINNNSVMNETAELMESLQKSDSRISFYDYDIPFNYSKINNYAVTLSKGEHIVLMNNDIEIISTDWIEALLEHSLQETTGAVGAKLYYPNDTIQHAGIIIGMGGFAGHSHKSFPKDSPGYLNRLMCVHNVSAVTGALMMVKKDLYNAVNGLDEVNLAIALNDVDFCLKLMEKKFRNIITPYCEAYHYESVSRGYEATPAKKERFNKEIAYFQKKWKTLLEQGDPYFPEAMAGAISLGR